MREMKVILEGKVKGDEGREGEKWREMEREREV